MEKRKNLVGAVLLIAVGLWFLIMELFPTLKDTIYETFAWPLLIIGVGVLLALIGLLARNPEMLIPACVVAGVGGILHYQNTTGDWGSWAYIWALIPGFGGVGTLLAGLLGGKREMVSGGLWTILISLIMLAIFGSFLGGPNLLGQYWPALLIVLGVVLLARGIFRRSE